MSDEIKKRYGKSKILEESWSRSIPILLARIFWLWIFSLFIRNLQKKLSKLMMMTRNEFYKRDRHRYYIRIRKNEFISTLYHEIIIFPISKTLDTSRNHIQWRNNHFTISNSVFWYLFFHWKSLISARYLSIAFWFRSLFKVEKITYSIIYHKDYHFKYE